MFLIIRFKAERERTSISTSIFFSSLPVGYHRVRTYEKKETIGGDDVPAANTPTTTH